MASSAQGSQALGLGLKQVSGRASHCLADHAATVGISDQPRIRHIPAGQPPDRGNAALQPERAQLTAKAIVPSHQRREVSLCSSHIYSVQLRTLR